MIKVKVRLKAEKGATTSQVRRVFVGEILPFDRETGNSLKDNFIRLKGKHLLLERHQANIEAMADPLLQEYFIPVERIEWITVLPEDLDLQKSKYQVVGGRLICSKSGKSISLKEKGEA